MHTLLYCVSVDVLASSFFASLVKTCRCWLNDDVLRLDWSNAFWCNNIHYMYIVIILHTYVFITSMWCASGYIDHVSCHTRADSLI